MKKSTINHRECCVICTFVEAYEAYSSREEIIGVLCKSCFHFQVKNLALFMYVIFVSVLHGAKRKAITLKVKENRGTFQWYVSYQLDKRMTSFGHQQQYWSFPRHLKTTIRYMFMAIRLFVTKWCIFFRVKAVFGINQFNSLKNLATMHSHFVLLVLILTLMVNTASSRSVPRPPPKRQTICCFT